MATWINGKAKLTSAGVHAIDDYIAGRLFEPIPTAAPFPTGDSYLSAYKTSQFMPGTWEEILYLQTGMQLYPALGGCSTADDTPSAGLYTHTFSLRTGQDPVNMGRHWERENTTDAESERIDILGMGCTFLHMECSEMVPIATQRLKWLSAFTKNSSTDDIAAASLTDIPFKWSNFSGNFTVTYNSVNLHDKMEIVGWAFDVINTVRFTGLDSDGYYSKGKYIPTSTVVTTLEVIPNNNDVFGLFRTPYTTIGSRTGYATDLDVVVKCQRTATDYIQWTHDKCYCNPVILSAEKTRASHERYLLILTQTGAGSISVVAVDDYDDDYYET
jgi:hypothetical protein